MNSRERNTGQRDSAVLSIPSVMLEAAGISVDSDLTVETLPGVLLIGQAEPLKTTSRPLYDLLAALGMDTEDVRNALKEGGYFDE